MANGMYHYLKQAWNNQSSKEKTQKMTEWRKSGAFVKLDKPSRIDRARTLGYKDKKGFVVLRAKIKRGGHKKPRPAKGRRSKRMTIRKTLKMNYKWIAEQRAERKYSNLVVLNSYPIGKDGMNYFFEIIMVDPSKPEIANDPQMKWVANKVNQKRALRGLTSSAKKSRGLRNKSPTNKVRPSVRAGGRKGK